MKTTSKDKVIPLILSLSILCLISACPSSGPPGGSNGPPGQDTTDMLAGQVSSIDGKALSGASVFLDNGRSASTDDNGFYSFDGLTPDARIVARFQKEGYAPTSKAITVGTTPGCIFLAEAAETVTISADTGSTQRSGDSAVTLAAGSLVDGDGTPIAGDVDLTATFLDPSTNGVMAFPGSFDDAQTQGGSDTTLESFGFAIYELTQEGAPVNLAGGSTADIEYILPENAQDRYSVGDTIPLWEFDDDTATWTEAGEGTIGVASDGTGRLAWFATVDHFSSWNCDAPIEDKNCITGRVLFDGTAVSGAEVSAIGVTYNGTSTVRTSTDGTFCVEVKIGSTIRLEVRLNGGATPVLTREITVANTQADCATGGCNDVGDLNISLDACVSGQVLNSDGTPAANVTVFVVPGASTTTDSNGNYCAAAVGNEDVYVFAAGRPSVAVRTSGSGSCGAGSCASADLNLTLPADGDEVGTLAADSNTVITGFVPDQDTFSLNGSFIVADAETLAELGSAGSAIPGVDFTRQEIDGCTVTTQTITLSSDTIIDPGTVLGFGGIGALDPGSPGAASNGTASVNLLRGDPASIDPPAPFLAGVFTPDEGSAELLALGFGAGQTINFSFPGGADIGAFDTSVAVPAAIVVTAPDFSDPDLSINLGAPLELAWVAGDPADIVAFVLVASSTEMIDNGDGTITTTGLSVNAYCEFPDDGSATVSADVTALLPSDGMTSTILSLSRRHEVTAAVPLMRVTGNGVVRVRGSSGVSRSIIALPDIPDIPDFCSLITCPDGQVCNPDTFMCEPG